MIFSVYNKRMMRRGVSQILGSLFMLAIVAGIGSVLLFQGVSGINAFNTSLSILKTDKQETLRENLIIEHVRFHDDSNIGGGTNFRDVTISIRNTGTVELNIDSIMMVEVDSQDLVLNNNTFPDLKPIFAKDIAGIPIETTLAGSPTIWDITKEYRITVTTTKGNSFEFVAKPFNT